MFLLFSLFFEDCNITNNIYSFSRCRLQNKESTWEKISSDTSIVFYLHENSKSQVIFNYQNAKLNPGQAIKFQGQEIKAKCSNKDCDLTIWYSDYDKDEGYVVAESAGVVYQVKNQSLSSRYVSYFDFGDSSRLVANSITHPRMTGVTFLYQNETGVFEHYIKQNENYTFSSPGILQFTKAPYDSVDIKIVAGSVKQMGDEYSQNEKITPLITIDNAGQRVALSNDDDPFCLVTAQANIEWIKWTTVAATILVFLISVSYSFYLFVVGTGRKKQRIENPNQTNLNQPLI